MLKLRPAKVAIEDGPSFDCSTTGESWNGWECPYFTKEQGEALLRSPGFESGRYDSEQDAFVFPCDEEGEPDVWPAVEVDGVKYYGIGAGCWIWSLAGETDEEGEYVEPTDPWAGDFSRGAWTALDALIHAYMHEAVERGHRGELKLPESLDCIADTIRSCEDEATLRTVLVEGLATLDADGIPVPDKLREHVGIVASGGNPWAE